MKITKGIQIMSTQTSEETRTEFIDRAAEELDQIARERASLSKKEKTIRDEVLALVTSPPKKGTVNLEGGEYLMKLVFAQNHSFSDKEVLIELIDNYLSAEQRELIFRTDYKEKTTGLEEFLATPPEDLEGVASLLKDLRVSKPAKVKITYGIQ
jgi:hypothetical protein